MTETLLALGLRPLACTRFCEQPSLDTVGGTKNPDVDAIAALAPDLVVVNDEENRIEDVERLQGLGLAIHDMSPRSLDDVGPAVCALAGAVGVDAPDPFPGWEEWMTGRRQRRPPAFRRVFVPVWRRPWMSMAADTFGSSLLELLGWHNVFAGATTRYPEVTLEEAADRRPEGVLLPSEPYVFKERHVAEVAAVLPDARILLVDGQDLFWWGIRTPGAVDRLAAALMAPRLAAHGGVAGDPDPDPDNPPSTAPRSEAREAPGDRR